MSTKRYEFTRTLSVTTTIKLPELGENVDSGELTKILVNVGDTVAKDDPLLELETEKATIEVPSPVSGVVKELHVQQGQKVKVGDALFTIEENGAGAKQKEQSQESSQKAKPEREPRAEEPPSQEQPSRTTKAQATGAAAAQARKPEPEAKPQARAEAKAEAKPSPKAEQKPEKTEPQ